MTVLPRVLAAVGALALGLGGALVVAAPAHAAALTVTSAVDDGLPGSLSYELGQLDPGVVNTIDIAVGGTITGPVAGFPTIFDDVVITSSAATRPILEMNAGGGSLNVSGASLSITGIDLVSDTAASGQGISVLDGSLILNDVSVRDFDWDIFYADTVGGHTIDLTDVDAGGTAVDPSTIGIAIQTPGGTVSLTRVAVDFTDGAGVLVGTSGGTVDFDTVSAADGSGILVQTTDTAITAAHLSTARTLDGVTFQIDNTTLDLTDLTVVDTDDVGAVIEAVNGSVVVLTTADISASSDSGIALDATDSTITATGITSHGNGVVPGCGCGGSGSGIELYADNSTVTLTAANSHDNDATFGGGIYVGEADNAGVVTISSATVTGNTASDDGGGIYVDGVADDGSSLTISDSVVSTNTAVDFGGGIYLRQIGGGATSTAKVTIVRTTVDGNSTTGGYGGGIAVDDPSNETSGLPTVLIDSSTLSNNTTPAGGGGLYIGGFSGPATSFVALTNSTVTGNLAQAGGGVYVEASGLPGPKLLDTVVSHSTIADNSAHSSAGIEMNSGNQSMEISNSILSGGTSDNGNPNPDDLDLGSPYSVLYSLVQTPNASVTVSPADGNITGVDPLLAPLANNGGVTKTRLITPGSPAYNAGDPAFAGAGKFDQRGQARVFERLDMGAVEWHPALAHTGVELTPGPPLVAFLLLFSGLAMVAFSRLRTARAVA